MRPRCWPDSPYRVGISGWRYPPWRKVYYPDGLPQRAELEYASRRLNSIELNGSFYSLQRPSSYQRWYDETPDGFVFAVKGPRFVTHYEEAGRRGRAAGQLLRLRSTCARQQTRTGAVAAPADPRVRRGAVRGLLRTRCRGQPPRPRKLPRATMSGWRVARCWSAPSTSRSGTQSKYATRASRPPDSSSCCASTTSRWSARTPPASGRCSTTSPSDFAYVRLHGADELYVSGYDDEALDRWARKIRAWKPERLHLLRQRREGPGAVRRGGARAAARDQFGCRRSITGLA